MSVPQLGFAARHGGVPRRERAGPNPQRGHAGLEPHGLRETVSEVSSSMQS